MATLYDIFNKGDLRFQDNEFYGHGFVDTFGNCIFTLRGDRIHSYDGDWIGELRGDRIFDLRGEQFGEFRGNRVYDSSGNYLCEVRRY